MGRNTWQRIRAQLVAAREARAAVRVAAAEQAAAEKAAADKAAADKAALGRTIGTVGGEKQKSVILGLSPPLPPLQKPKNLGFWPNI